jgi:hypothetical protein
MSREELAQAIAKGLVETGVEGPYDCVTRSTAGDYPSMGCSQWEGLDGGRGDILLGYIDGGSYYAGRAYSDIDAAGELEALAGLLGSEQGQAAQNQILADDCREKYLPALAEVDGLTNPACIIYAGIWCPTSHYVVRNFLQRRVARGYDANSLEAMRDMFRDEYAIAADCADYMDGYANRANTTYDYVAGLEVSA